MSGGGPPTARPARTPRAIRSMRNGRTSTRRRTPRRKAEGFFKPEYIRDYYNDYFAMLAALD